MRRGGHCKQVKIRVNIDYPLVPKEKGHCEEMAVKESPV